LFEEEEEEDEVDAVEEYFRIELGGVSKRSKYDGDDE
jgi:hypothetical protein